MWYFEVIGYLGMFFVILSFLLKNMTWLRLLNMIGGSLCMIYGFVTKTYPTAILNLILVIINFCFLIKYYITKNKKEVNKQDI